MSSSEEKNNVKDDSKWLLWMGIAATFAILAANYFFLVDKSTDVRGTFGDMFGISTSLFTGLAFVGLIYTIQLQRKDLNLQMDELKANRAELQGQKVQLEAQVNSLNVQNFENTFFQLLRLYNDNVGSMSEKKFGGEVIAQGRECFSSYYSKLKRYYSDSLGRDATAASFERIEVCLEKLYDVREAGLAHNFRTLYSILKFVDQSHVINKKMYANLVRSQLSSFELLILFYNCIGSRGSEKFKPLIEKYALLKHVPMDELIDSDHVEHYHPSAFGKGPL